MIRAPAPIAAPRLNAGELATLSVTGRIAPPLTKAAIYRIGQDGGLRLLPGPGGITPSHRVGDACVGLAADHLEPAVSIRAPERPGRGPGATPDAANRSLNVLACAGNRAEVMSGPATGAKGLVTGKHGGVAHVMVDFPVAAMRRMRVGDLIQIWAVGQGLRLRDFPDVAVMNAAPDLLARSGVRVLEGRLSVPATHLVPAALMGSGLGKSSAARGDYDIQLFDRRITRRYRLDTLRFGDFVLIVDADGRYGRAYRSGHVTWGLVVHGDSTVAGHGPGVMTLLSGPASRFALRHDAAANLARAYRLRPLGPPRRTPTLVEKTKHLSPHRSVAAPRRLDRRSPA